MTWHFEFINVGVDQKALHPAGSFPYWEGGNFKCNTLQRHVSSVSGCTIIANIHMMFTGNAPSKQNFFSVNAVIYLNEYKFPSWRPRDSAQSVEILKRANFLIAFLRYPFSVNKKKKKAFLNFHLCSWAGNENAKKYTLMKKLIKIKWIQLKFLL